MAIFPSATVGSIEKNDSIEKVNQYLRKLNDDLTYMFNNLTPEDNYSASAPKLIYSVDENGEASFEISTGGIKMQVASNEYVKSNVEILNNKISLKVSVGDVCESVQSEIDMDGKSITFTTGSLLIFAKNLTLDEEGNATFSGALSAATGTFQGALSGGTISIGGTATAPAFEVDEDGNLTATSGTFSGELDGATIYGDHGLVAGRSFWVTYQEDSQGYVEDYEIGCGSFFFGVDTPYGDVFEANNSSSMNDREHFMVDASDGKVYCQDVYPWTSGYNRWQNGLAYYVDLLWDWYEEEHGGGGGDDPDPEPEDSELDGPLDP